MVDHCNSSFQENMKGGSLTRFRPDSKQEGKGLKDILMDVLEDSAAGGWRGLNRSHNPLKASDNVASSVTKGFKRGLKRGLEKEIRGKPVNVLKTYLENESFYTHLLSSHQTVQMKTTRCG